MRFSRSAITALRLGALVMRRLALDEPDGHVILLVDAFEDVGDAALGCFRG